MDKITVGIPTRNRYDILGQALMSIALQSRRPDEVIIVDDTDVPNDLTTIERYRYIFQLFDEYKIKWRVIFGGKKGPHDSHQIIQNAAIGDWIFRMDDDCVADPFVLEDLYNLAISNKDIGAVAPSVLMPGAENLPDGLKNEIAKIGQNNVQWYKFNRIIEAEHLYSCYLYKKGIVNFDLSLSPKGHREETIHSHSIYRAGYKLLIQGSATVWHLRSTLGGIRTNNDIADYHLDETTFNGYLNMWGVCDTKWMVLDNGIGDHYAAMDTIDILTNNGVKLNIACCYPDVFAEVENVTLHSIDDAKKQFTKLDMFDIYKFMWDNNWKKSVVLAYKKMYL